MKIFLDTSAWIKFFLEEEGFLVPTLRVGTPPSWFLLVRRLDAPRRAEAQDAERPRPAFPRGAWERENQIAVSPITYAEV